MDIKIETIMIRTELKIPIPPNFLRYSENDQPLDVADIEVEDLKKIGEAWTKQLIEHSLKRRKLKKEL